MTKPDKPDEPKIRFEVMQPSPGRRIVKVTIPAEAVRKLVAEKLEAVQKIAVLKGFRKGKVPAETVRKLCIDTVLAETQKQLIEANTLAILDQEQVDKSTVVGDPEIKDAKVSEKKGLTYTICLSTKPKPEPGSVVDFTKKG